MADVNLTIVGLGRVGTSFGLALKRYQETSGAKHHFTITGYDENRGTCDEAKKLGAVDDCARRLSAACEGADIIFIDAPLSALETYLEKIGPMLKAGCVVLETAALKQPPIEWAKRYLPESAYLIGLSFVLNMDFVYQVDNTPAQADPDLFKVDHLYIAAAADCPEEAVQLAADLSSLLDLKPHFLDPAEHDGLVAAVEGIPMLLSLAMVGTATEASSWLDMRRLTNPPFALTTAVLEQRPEAIFAFLQHNRANVLHYLDQTIDQLSALRDAMRAEDDDALTKRLDEVAKAYLEWWAQRRFGKWDEKLDFDMKTIGSTINPFGGLFGRRKKDDEED
jgi:prephenate dehydrogenase